MERAPVNCRRASVVDSSVEKDPVRPFGRPTLGGTPPANAARE